MSQHNRLFTLSNSLMLVQGTINKILQSNFAGHQKEFEENISRLFSIICLMDCAGEVDLSKLQDHLEKTLPKILSEVNFDFNFPSENPSSIRQRFKVIENK